MSAIYTTVIYQPILNLLIFFYQTIAFNDLGVAIILVTLVVRLILFPIFQKSVRHQTVMQRLNPEIKKIQDQHKNDRQKQGEAMIALYKEHKINPFSGIFLLLVQLPILFALFQIFNNILDPNAFDLVYSFISAPQNFQTHFFGTDLIPLEKSNIIIAGLAAIAQYFQAYFSLAKTKPGEAKTTAEQVGRQMVYIMPAITFAFLFTLPAAIGLYWIVTSLFSVVQQKIVNKEFTHDKLGNIRKGNDGDGRV